jgi:hypothetical protein
MSEALRSNNPPAVLKCGRSTRAFDTRTVRICPIGDDAPFAPAAFVASPRRAVREVGNVRLVPERIGQWLAVDPATLPWLDPAFQVWAGMAAPNLVRSLANEVDDDVVTFRGPPLVRLLMSNPAPATAMGAKNFAALSNAASWVFDNEREMEMRHGLFASEIARLANRDQDAYGTIGRLASDGLESARIAYGLNLSQVSRDSLKAQADLRKAVSDETSRLSDGTRTLAGAVATSLSAGLGVVLAKLTTKLPDWMLVGLTLVLTLYVGSVIWSGWRFVVVQRSIRTEWRRKLYQFLPEADYRSMVEEPASMAEDGFRLAAISGGGLTAIMFVLVSLLVFLHAGPGDKKPPSGAHIVTPSNTTTASEATKKGVDQGGSRAVPPYGPPAPP